MSTDRAEVEEKVRRLWGRPEPRLLDAIIALVAEARLEQAETMYDIYDSHAWVTDNPAIEPALREERERLRHAAEEGK